MRFKLCIPLVDFRPNGNAFICKILLSEFLVAVFCPCIHAYSSSSSIFVFVFFFFFIWISTSTLNMCPVFLSMLQIIQTTNQCLVSISEFLTQSLIIMIICFGFLYFYISVLEFLAFVHFILITLFVNSLVIIIIIHIDWIFVDFVQCSKIDERIIL